jgi:hypothetical protein
MTEKIALARIKASKDDLHSERTRKGSAADLMKELSESEIVLMDIGTHDQAYRRP